MTNTTSLLELLLNLLRDPDALAAYRDDPDGFLASCGDVSPEDIRDALVLLRDNDDNDFSRDHNTGGNHVHVPPPHEPRPEPGESDHEAAVRYLNTYITNNHIDDRDTIVDNSVNQNIDTDGGDFDQDIDVDSNVVSGDGAVGAGDDIEDSTVVTGDDNTVGDDNITGDGNVIGDDNEAVIGDDNATGFGKGDVSTTEVDGDLNADDGSAVSVGGNAGVDNTDNSTSDSFNSDTTVEDSYNTEVEHTDNSDNSVDNSSEDNSRTDDHSERHVEADLV